MQPNASSNVMMGAWIQQAIETLWDEVMRRRISARWTGQPLLNLPGLLFLVVMSWFTWEVLGTDSAWFLAIYIAITCVVLYYEYHIRRLELDELHLYVGRFLRSGFVTIPYGRVKSIRLRRPFLGQVTITFHENTDVGAWIILQPQRRFWTNLAGHPDVVELQNRVSESQRLVVE